MSEERTVDEIITTFFLNTCRLHQRLSEPNIHAAVRLGTMMTLRSPDGEEDEIIPVTTGSVAEFYIEPMLPHVGDVDVMWHFSTDLAIPRGYPPPKQLPAEFHNYVRVVEIIDSHFPGYVYLKLRYLLTECPENNEYTAVAYDRQTYLANRLTHTDEEFEYHGPAKRYTAPTLHLLPCYMPSEVSQNSVDDVHCTRCLVWLPQAADWPKRHKSYGWPDSATVDHVVNNGCDVVGVAHRQCRQHEWNGKCQWRLSFSRAEVVLMNSMIPIQQIVYHMLRVFVKTEQLSDIINNSEKSTVSNYHIKTLMLWACELKSRSWWTDDLSLLRICVELLHTLAVWLTCGGCPHYFISNCDLFDQVDCSYKTATVHYLLEVTQPWLSAWFVKNYIRKCAQLCSGSVARLFNDVNTSRKLLDAVSVVNEWRLSSSQFRLCTAFYEAQFMITHMLSTYSTTVRSCHCCKTEMAKINTRLRDYFTAVMFLHVSYKMLSNSPSNKFLDILATNMGQFLTPRHVSSSNNMLLSLNKAVKLMKVAAKKSLCTVQLIEIEMSKAYLYTALRYTDTDSIYCRANAYLAVLCYTTGQYYTALNHCTLITRSQDHSKCHSHVVRGNILPKIDDNVDNVLGIVTLYQYLHTETAAVSLNRSQVKQDSVFTTEVLAHYLHIRCLSVTEGAHTTEASSIDRVQLSTKYMNYTNQPYMPIADIILLKIVNVFSDKTSFDKKLLGNIPQRATNPQVLNTLRLVELLQKSAAEQLTSLRHLEARDFGSVGTIVTTDFEAIYAYKRANYQQCLLLSTQNVRTLLCAGLMPSVQTFPEFIQLLDDDIASLTALTLMVNSSCSTSSLYVCISQLTLSLYLMTQCQLKLRYSVQPLAETLYYIKVAQIKHPANRVLNRLTLKLIERKTVRNITTLMNALRRNS